MFGIAAVEKIRAKHIVFLERMPAVPDLQAAWLLLLFCTPSRA